MRRQNVSISIHKKGNSWEKFPDLGHLDGQVRTDMQVRRRHRHVRYWCYRLQNLIATDRELEGPEKQPGFIEFWLEQKPLYALDPRNEKISVPKDKKLKVKDIGGYLQFARIWDIDKDLNVYIRHSSVWHEWNLTLMKIVPFLGDAP